MVDELLQTVYSKILEDLNPRLSNLDWMKSACFRSKETFLETIDRMNETPFDQFVKELLDQFDETVNPYLNSDKLNNINDYLSNLHIQVNCEPNIWQLVIKLLGTNNTVKYERKTDEFLNHEFSYCLDYRFNEGSLYAYHGFLNDSVDENKNGEIFFMTSYDKITGQSLEIVYNLTTGMVSKDGCEFKKLTSDMAVLIYEGLLKAIESSKNIIINNLPQPLTINSKKKN